MKHPTSKPLENSDVSGSEFSKEMLNGDPTFGINFDRIQYHKSAKRYVILEYLLCDDPELIFSSNVKIDHNMLPTGIAPGGVPDFKADKGDHLFIIEPTLHEKKAIKQNEHEPVIRHLAREIEPLDITERNQSYGVFIAVHESINMINACRYHAKNPYYVNDDRNRKIDNLYIMPLVIDDLINILKSGGNYQNIYEIFSDLFKNPEADGYKWYEERVKLSINNL